MVRLYTDYGEKLLKYLNNNKIRYFYSTIITQRRIYDAL